MSVKFSETICKRSKTNRKCVLKHISSNPVGDGIIKHIWGCVRCGSKSITPIHQKDVECAMSPSLKHTWITDRQIDFQQHYRYREIKEIQSCSCCGAVREYEYQSMIGYQQKR
jgi:hypothetical protein